MALQVLLRHRGLLVGVDGGGPLCLGECGVPPGVVDAVRRLGGPVVVVGGRGRDRSVVPRTGGAGGADRVPRGEASDLGPLVAGGGPRRLAAGVGDPPAAGPGEVGGVGQLVEGRALTAGLGNGLDPLWRTSKIKGFGPRRMMSIMESMGKKRPRPRRSFTPEFKAEIVGLCRRGDRSVGQVAKDFDPTGTAVRDRVRQAEVDAGERDGLTSSEREEPARLRRENRRLREDVEILKRATAFFATETR
ncbi:predicted protein [Streptomyces viridosporus ATCC 14672]|uniref:Predicted protein n=2 Tax=Streptomyces viridosporus TaxID=67581 RepID=D6A8M0_STRV1|nr:predicted protein [Streptomyces viridosporus ATCC 14672]